MSTVPPCGTPEEPVSSVAVEMTGGFRHKPSKADVLCMRGRESTIGLTEVAASRSQTTNEPARGCNIERFPQSPTSSQNGACEGTAADAAVACSAPLSSPATAPRGRRRTPPSPRGRPSSPLRPATSSSPSSCASGSPARRRGSPVASAPRGGGPSSIPEDTAEVLATSLVDSTPAFDLPRSCYYGMAALSDDIFGFTPQVGASWKGGSTRRSTRRSRDTAVNIVMSCSREPLVTPEADTSPRVPSSSSSSSSSAAPEQASATNNTIATTTTTTTTTTAAAAASAAATGATTVAAAARKKARRVTWSPMVLAREEAAAFIRPYVKRLIEAEDFECRTACCETATKKFVQRRVEERAERKRGGVPAATICPPAAKRGAFFGLLACLYKPQWMGFKMWPQDPFFASAPLLLKGSLLPAASRGGVGGEISAPPGSASTLGDAVRGMSVSMRSRGQSRA